MSWAYCSHESQLSSRLSQQTSLRFLEQHAGILREENIALRQILGYRLGTYLPSTSIKDISLVSVDVDTGGGYEAISEEQSFHIGMSILDTRSLTQQPQDLGDAVKSYQFINNNSKPCRWAAKSFLFGESKLIELIDLPTSSFLLTQGRDYFFNNLNPEIANGASYILDTVKAAQYPLQLYYRYSLENLLDKFNIRYAKLHAAGNDAHFALKALIMIAVRDGQMASAPETTTPTHEDLFRILGAVAHAPVAVPTKPKLGILAKHP
ncbi:QDE-2-interacting protein [Trichoderma compactum]